MANKKIHFMEIELATVAELLASLKEKQFGVARDRTVVYRYTDGNVIQFALLGKDANFGVLGAVSASFDTNVTARKFSLSVYADPLNDSDLSPKKYVDTVNTSLSGRIDALEEFSTTDHSSIVLMSPILDDAVTDITTLTGRVVSIESVLGNSNEVNYTDGQPTPIQMQVLKIGEVRFKDGVNKVSYDMNKNVGHLFIAGNSTDASYSSMTLNSTVGMLVNHSSTEGSSNLNINSTVGFMNNFYYAYNGDTVSSSFNNGSIVSVWFKNWSENSVSYMSGIVIDINVGITLLPKTGKGVTISGGASFIPKELDAIVTNYNLNNKLEARSKSRTRTSHAIINESDVGTKYFLIHQSIDGLAKYDFYHDIDLNADDGDGGLIWNDGSLNLPDSTVQFIAADDVTYESAHLLVLPNVGNTTPHYIKYLQNNIVFDSALYTELSAYPSGGNYEDYHKITQVTGTIGIDISKIEANVFFSLGVIDTANTTTPETRASTVDQTTSNNGCITIFKCGQNEFGLSCNTDPNKVPQALVFRNSGEIVISAVSTIGIAKAQGSVIFDTLDVNVVVSTKSGIILFRGSLYKMDIEAKRSGGSNQSTYCSAMSIKYDAVDGVGSPIPLKIYSYGAVDSETLYTNQTTKSTRIMTEVYSDQGGYIVGDPIPYNLATGVYGLRAIPNNVLLTPDLLRLIDRGFESKKTLNGTETYNLSGLNSSRSYELNMVPSSSDITLSLNVQNTKIDESFYFESNNETTGVFKIVVMKDTEITNVFWDKTVNAQKEYTVTGKYVKLKITPKFGDKLIVETSVFG